MRSRRRVEEQLAGDYLSGFKGRGTEFEEVRPYAPGDEIRSIDWNVTARTGVPHTKRSIEERELIIHILVDISHSSDFGSTGESKRQAAAELAAMFAWSAIKANDRVALTLFSDQIEASLPPGKGTVQVMRILDDTLHYPCRGKGTDLNVALDHLARTAKRHCVALILSDFLSPDFRDSLTGVSYLHDLIAMEIRDPSEKNLPAAGLVRLRDNESEKLRVVDTSDPSVQYDLTHHESSKSTRFDQLFSELSIDHFLVELGDDYGDPLQAFFRARKHRQGGRHA